MDAVLKGEAKIMADVKLVNFEEWEFKCKCGCGGGYNRMKNDFIEHLMHAREIADVPFIIDSAFRCPTYNIIVGGKKRSAHLRGYAVDIVAGDSNTYWMILAAVILAGFERIGLGQNFIHIDGDPTLPRKVAWNYYE